MEDREILNVIHALVAEEHRLRDERDKGTLSEGAELARLREVEENLDHMWDMLRRRRALRAAGIDPDTVDLRLPLEVAEPPAV
jgi:hypothetical protein